MEYLSAIGTLLILLVFGGGLVIVAYLTFDDMRARGLSWSAGSFQATVNSWTERLKAMPAGPAVVGAAVIAGAMVVYAASGNFERPPVATATVEDSATDSAPVATGAAETPTAPAASAAPAAPTTATANAMASMATPGAVRTVTSSSCASNGCPVSCGADETLASAYCISGGAARLTDQLQVKDGVVTARCSPGASSITVACARK